MVYNIDKWFSIIYSFKVNYIGLLLIVKKYQMRSYAYLAQ
jgi:hypothetical protein